MPSTKKAGAVAAGSNANHDSDAAERALREYLQSLYPPPVVPRELSRPEPITGGQARILGPTSRSSSALRTAGD
jgi:hypothetical protein